MGEPAGGRPPNLLQRLEAAYDAVCALSRGDQRWRMSVPVQADDPDVLIGTALRDAIAALSRPLGRRAAVAEISGGFVPAGGRPPKRRYTKFEDGLMAAAYHLDYLGEDRLRDDVLRLQSLTVDDLRKSYGHDLPSERKRGAV